jgi:hypothetical protein
MVDEIMAMREIDMFTTPSDLFTLRDYCVCSLRTNDISSLHSYGTYASQETMFRVSAEANLPHHIAGREFRMTLCNTTKKTTLFRSAAATHLSNSSTLESDALVSSIKPMMSKHLMLGYTYSDFGRRLVSIPVRSALNLRRYLRNASSGHFSASGLRNWTLPCSR